MSQHEFTGLQHDRAYQEMMRLFDELTFRERMRRMMDGLGKPRDTGEYKFARLQLQRLSAPLVAFVAPLVLVAVLIAFGDLSAPATRQVPVEIVNPDVMDELEEPPPEEVPDYAEPMEIDVTVDITLPETVTTVEDRPMSPQPSAIDAVAIIRSPIVMRGIFGSRNPGARGDAIRRHGGSAAGEAAVMRALRWLAKNQQADGSWGSNKSAMTGLALLSFLAHGETPASEEFGVTVEKAIRFFVSTQQPDGLFRHRDNHNYSHPIATYALAEAYTLTGVPMLKEVVERAMGPIIRGQNPSGGWTYNMQPSGRDDTSYMGWCAQAIKAAMIAGDLEIPGLEEAAKLAIRGFKGNAHPEGGFGYINPGRGGLTSIGVLSMQLLGAGSDPDARNGLNLIDSWVVGFPEGENVPGNNHQYYFYYATQAIFHAAGVSEANVRPGRAISAEDAANMERWRRWNARMLPTFVSAQTIIPKEQSGYVDHLGRPHDIGFWENTDRNTDRPVMDTTLTALQLMVYYRYLPTFQTPAVADAEVVLRQETDVPVEIRF